jgi:hypothetical protein
MIADPMLPAEELVLRNARPTRIPGDPERDEPLTTDNEVISWIGELQARNGFPESALVALLDSMLGSGEIESVPGHKRGPWTREDVARWAHQGAQWHKNPLAVDAKFIHMMGDEKKVPPPAGDRMNLADLMKLELPPIRWAIKDLLPEGLGVLASPPKAGKSLLCYQLAIELSLGGEVLGKTAETRTVLYYALEDGRRRSQERARGVLSGRRVNRNIEFRWDAPPLGGFLEAEVDGWLGEHPLGVVIIDVLAKVRPASTRTSLNAYDQDYQMLTLLHNVTKSHPGCIVLMVTHDRKAGSDDWMTRITGTRGVAGVADFTIFLDRKRGAPTGTFYFTGRDMADDAIDAGFDAIGWTVNPDALIIAAGPTRQLIAAWLKANPGWHPPIDISDSIPAPLDAKDWPATVRGQLRKMATERPPQVDEDLHGHRGYRSLSRA